MSEWQPARWRQVHDRPLLSLAERRKYERLLYHIRPTSLIVKSGPYGVSMKDCGAEQFYEVKEWPGYFMCECEVLTD
jgi:hypothetical protein